jgi:hypothetical protein
VYSPLQTDHLTQETRSSHLRSYLTRLRPVLQYRLLPKEDSRARTSLELRLRLLSDVCLRTRLAVSTLLF